MGKTIAEKILSNKSKKDVYAGDIVIAEIDFCMGQDGTSPLAIKKFKEIGGKKLFNPEKVALVIDHNSPSPSEKISELHKLMREFAYEQNCKLYEIGEGVCHQVIPEKGNIIPGDLVVGADSHTTTYGALGCCSTGIGSTDLAVVFISGKLWFKVPNSLKITLQGNLPKGVFSKDLALFLTKEITADGATYLSVEYEGEAISQLSLDARFTLCNMAVEIGAKFGIIQPDEKTINWLKERTKRKFEIITPDPDANYLAKKEFDVSSLTPQIAKPHSVENVCSVKEIEGTIIHQGFIGTCTNGRLEDLRIAANILKDKKVKARTIIAPASKDIYLSCLKEGIIETFLNSGCVVVNPGCACCVGTHQGIPSDGENVISSANRNFLGRMGNNKANIFLASPATVAASCIEGKIADPRKYL
jgi:3-isopropylmalate/(R)-2-methylmalate dehydratase large subunit